MNQSTTGTSSRRVALLGAGYISKFHAEAIRAIPQLELAAVCDVSEARAQALADGCGVPRIYSTLDTMLEQEALEAVHVLLPPPAHAAAVRRILDAGVDVLAEKPLGISSQECEELSAMASQRRRRLGVSHNFLFSPNYERFATDFHAGRFGRVDHVDIVWNKPLGQLQGGPFGGWLFAQPDNVLFEVGPHSFAHVAHLVGELDELSVAVRDRVELPLGKEFFRRWEALGWKGGTSVRLRFSFGDGYSQHFIQVRGTSAAAIIDFEQDTYSCNEHSTQMLDVDRYLTVTKAAREHLGQARETLGRFLFSKLGLSREGAPFQRSITHCVRTFYQAGPLDVRAGAEVATTAVRLAERMRDAAQLPRAEPTGAVAPSSAEASVVPGQETVLVLGGTGFIGRALVRRLLEAGYGVRALVRTPGALPDELSQPGVTIVRGDLLDAESLDVALEGVQHVFHLARGTGETWEDYLRTDVEPTRRLAELCLEKRVKRLYYTSSIAIYHAGKSAGTITEATAPHPGVLRTNVYARAKVEIERMLLELHRQRGLGVAIFRPGIVLGPGGNPLHWGVASWPFPSVPRLWGAGNDPLPIVLVDDCADALVRAIDVAGIEGETFNLVGEPCLTAQEYLDEVERAAGLKFHRVPTSSVRYFVEDVGKYLIKTAGRDPNRKLPSFANWEGRTCAARFDASRARTRLGWTPTSDRARVVREGIELPAREFLA